MRELAVRDAILDQFVMGLENKGMREKLLFDDPCELDVAIEKAKTMWMAREQPIEESIVNVIRSSRPGSADKEQPNHSFRRSSTRHRSPNRNYLLRSPSSVRSGSSQASSRESSRNRGRSDRECSKCGYEEHYHGTCPAGGKVCANCGKRNHFARCCRVTTNTRWVEKFIQSLSGRDREQLTDISIGCFRLTALVDCGAAANMITWEIAKKMQVPIIKSFTNLKNYSGDRINVAGKLVVPVECAGRHVFRDR